MQALEAKARGEDHGYARRLMPRTTELEHQIDQLGHQVEVGGLAADSGPVASALAVAAYQRMIDGAPELEQEIETKWTRMGIHELVEEWAWQCLSLWSPRWGPWSPWETRGR